MVVRRLSFIQHILGTQLTEGYCWHAAGGHALGSGYEILYEPDGLIKQAAEDGQPLIFVAVNYRLGFFGFATSEAMVKSGYTNAGLRDQRAAFECM